MNTIDLYLGGDIGAWVLQNVSNDTINQIFTFDIDILHDAQKKDIKAFHGNANSFKFDPASIGLSIHYPRLIKPHLIDRYQGMYNIHPAYLPWGRGYYPIFWALWEETPAGATLHEISSGLDEGPIIAQIKVEYYRYDTGESLFQRVREAEKALFVNYWPRILEGKEMISFAQPEGGTYHTKQDFYDLKRGKGWESMSSSDLVRLIRAFTFPGYTGLELTLGEKRFELHLEGLVDA